MFDKVKTSIALENRESYLDIISDIKSSKHHENVLLIFFKDHDYKTPSEISKIEEIGIPHACEILKDLKNMSSLYVLMIVIENIKNMF
ncbi:hypothetical protein ALNOE001_16610 [Candidatus Methanobinarius endosymbioticus]|uniref:Uncharacterized protein n=1 Tax=Candidatus Methanobinarius endosymbioticus TaxID=2006182 RepID=A0A366MAR8_9EURY|nr:hypothetical protein ALNOE001_16610 [Candidatus Methanobinarius endosymbioticus]